MKMVKISDPGCAGSACPTVYESDRDTLVIQGLKLSEEDKNSIKLPDTEDAIEIPKSLIKNLDFAKL